MDLSLQSFEQSRAYRQYLVDRLAQVCTPALQNAFLAIPREAFLDGYYQQEGNQFSWTWIAAPSAQASEEEVLAWLDTIYHDVAFTTRIDSSGRPLCSSSQPSVMADMLTALAIEPGQRVLEIGTGTGYNAALIAHLTGSTQLVTTIEIDVDLATRAQQQLDLLLGSGIEVLNEDGLVFNTECRYERIVVTGSFPSVPHGWLNALVPGGLLVMDFRGDLAGGLLRLCKESDGTVSGHFFPAGRGIFMPLRFHNLPIVRPAIELDGPVSEEVRIEIHAFPPEVLQHSDAALWLQCLFPALRLRRQYANQTNALIVYIIDAPRHTTAVLQQGQETWQVTVYGTACLWSELYAAYQQWIQEGRPGRETYRVSINPEGDFSLFHQNPNDLTE